MKNLKTLLLPVIMVLAGAGSAYASHSGKQSEKALVRGYAYHENEAKPCIPSEKVCDTSGTFICSGDVGMGNEDLYQLSGTVCPNVLTHTSP
ncbi:MULTISPECIES: DUF6520 family protein [unclassified Kaistella]|uniref:DUF6520 family protein n=1 Tax=unclassified Kaistella TaxID=2762626 RepID=UPI00273625C6|nr:MULTISPECIES: DUF6520 family protein [unclassified Kaistella]MDP2455295.1 DUF6520 family protein [Kaistella sp. SH11-4b]MDP2458108.1 DUF6520 family protein [Kaistella sp. SH40-3]MDP2461112.1 DUF6520 family protein [Kaistella sp. SH19-2b]